MYFNRKESARGHKHYKSGRRSSSRTNSDLSESNSGVSKSYSKPYSGSHIRPYSESNIRPYSESYGIY